MTNTTFIFITISIPFTRWDLQSIPFQLFTFRQFSFSFYPRPVLTEIRNENYCNFKCLPRTRRSPPVFLLPSHFPENNYPVFVTFSPSLDPSILNNCNKQSVAPTSPVRTTTRTLSPRKPETLLVQQFNIGLSTYQMRGKSTYRPSIRIVHSTITKEGRQRRNIVELKGSQPSPSNNNTNTNIFRFA